MTSLRTFYKLSLHLTTRNIDYWHFWQQLDAILFLVTRCAWLRNLVLCALPCYDGKHRAPPNEAKQVRATTPAKRY